MSGCARPTVPRSPPRSTAAAPPHARSKPRSKCCAPSLKRRSGLPPRTSCGVSKKHLAGLHLGERLRAGAALDDDSVPSTLSRGQLGVWTRLDVEAHGKVKLDFTEPAFSRRVLDVHRGHAKLAAGTEAPTVLVTSVARDERSMEFRATWIRPISVAVFAVTPRVGAKVASPSDSLPRQLLVLGVEVCAHTIDDGLPKSWVHRVVSLIYFREKSIPK
ncbi:hypothetical protein M885DRAFT_536014 [Pelagophyceae sp. CCMP2097]|nr:hypothetical protein M885DRAFT_536014 [Pelagophyceae sp. CCMP2097]